MISVIRIEIINSDKTNIPGRTRGYVTRDNKGTVRLTSCNGTPEALSNVVVAENSEHVRFCIEDARDEAAALKALRPHLSLLYTAKAWRAS